MEFRKKTGFLVLFLVFSSGCLNLGDDENEDNADVGAEIISAINEVETYKFISQITISTKGAVGDVPVELKDVISGTGAVDSPRKHMFFDVKVSSESSQAVAPTENTMKVYFIDDTAVFVTDNGSVQEKIPDSRLIWEGRTQLKQQAEILSVSNVTVEGTEKLKGTSTRVLSLNPPIKDLVTYLSQQASIGGAPLQISDERIDDLTGMVDDVYIRMWVGETDNLPRKFAMQMTLSSDDLTRETTVIMEMWDYGVPLDVDFPNIE